VQIPQRPFLLCRRCRKCSGQERCGQCIKATETRPSLHAEKAKAQASQSSSPRQLKGCIDRTGRAGSTHHTVTPLTPECCGWAFQHLTQQPPMFTKATIAKVLLVFKGPVVVMASSQLSTQLEELNIQWRRPNALSAPRLGNHKLVALQPQSSHSPVALLLSTSTWAQVWDKGVSVTADSLAHP